MARGPGNGLFGWKLTGSSSHGLTLGLKEQEKDGGLAKRDGSLGRKLKDILKVAGVLEAGPSSSNWAAGLGCHSSVLMEGLEREGPNANQEKAGLLGCLFSRKRPTPEDALTCWVPEEIRREQRVDGFSMTDHALEEEAKRGIRGGIMGDKSTWLTVYEGNDENVNGSWKLGEANKNRDKARCKEESDGASGIQVTENEKEELWRSVAW
ncbi:hypothetical protein CK203_019094 [Vitis vinifera]|uniref:Uncharacterized protein n=1 Tax=Vitis vinifera TaxID=29760 RepID=A0A438IQU1_VITVI|nr:hypothetical protein CK203_019094 [Vitis vinifera]